MSEHIHAGPFLPVKPGFCTWRHRSFGTWLSCADTAIPGADQRANCYIREAHDRANRGLPA